ncbi:hypothetical protein [Streptomyces sp. NPDC088350]|uniref:hypothetical protein n=1 Tax=Streptomyces sp. NPDC088350 TaxID=3365854 RepID=UPI00380E3EA3
MTALALSPTARPQRAARRLHRPALIVWVAFVLLGVGALLLVLTALALVAAFALLGRRTNSTGAAV